MTPSSNTFQWEHKRRWDIAGNSFEFCRAEGALLVPGFRDFSIFFRRESQSASTFELALWTAPVFFRPLDESFDNNPNAWLVPVALAPNAISMTGTGAEVFAATVSPSQPVGTMLFWQMKNTTSTAGQIVGDIYLVANHSGVVSLPRFVRTMEATSGTQGSGVSALTGRR